MFVLTTPERALYLEVDEMVRKAKKVSVKETLAQGIARVRASDPGHANDAEWISASLCANHDAVREQLSQIQKRELASELSGLPNTFELRSIADSVLKNEITTDEVLEKLGKLVTKPQAPDTQDVKNFALISKHMLAVLRTKLDIVAMQLRAPMGGQQDLQHKRLLRTSEMTAVSATPAKPAKH